MVWRGLQRSITKGIRGGVGDKELEINPIREEWGTKS